MPPKRKRNSARDKVPSNLAVGKVYFIAEGYTAEQHVEAGLPLGRREPHVVDLVHRGPREVMVTVRSLDDATVRLLPANQLVGLRKYFPERIGSWPWPWPALARAVQIVAASRQEPFASVWNTQFDAGGPPPPPLPPPLPSPL